MPWRCMGALGPYSYIHIKYIRSKGRAKGHNQMGRVPQMWGPFAMELYGSSRALYGASGAIPISWLRSSGEPGFGMECGQESQLMGPEKEAAAICGAFVRHAPRFQPFLVFGVISFKFFDRKGRRQSTSTHLRAICLICTSVSK